MDDERRPRRRIIAKVFGRNRRSGIRRRTRKWSRMASVPISCMWSAVKTSKVSTLLIKTIVDQVNPSQPSRNLPSLLQKHRAQQTSSYLPFSARKMVPDVEHDWFNVTRSWSVAWKMDVGSSLEWKNERRCVGRFWSVAEGGPSLAKPFFVYSNPSPTEIHVLGLLCFT